MGRFIRYVGRASGNPTSTLPDGREVALDEVVEVNPRDARVLLANPGEADDRNAEWVPAPREGG